MTPVLATLFILTGVSPCASLAEEGVTHEAPESIDAGERRRMQHQSGCGAVTLTAHSRLWTAPSNSLRTVGLAGGLFAKLEEESEAKMESVVLRH